MDRANLDRRLSGITTAWTLLRRAHEGDEPARALVLHRYGGAVRRYLLGALRDEEAADDLVQEFALAFLRGAFHSADPARGRFRDYLKGVLSNLVNDHRRRGVKRPRALPPDALTLAGLTAEEDRDRAWRESWRDELLANTWAALADAQPSLHAVLRCKADLEGRHSEDVAEELARRTGRQLTANALRQALHRARRLFAELLVHEVAQSLADPTLEAVEEELAELRLLEYCGPALGRPAGEKG